ncbi:hypothetical protein [Clostridium beijerinckii]|uniref:hypothetical protein n=1 Tax=Clostridium beijerinckii TaxID=1520 RepID=UPI001F4BFD3A|nr:hypothetical protein [Clostridium beijerinckii]NRX18963.1 hypothetical protein [Clostridium beijerinckii]
MEKHVEEAKKFFDFLARPENLQKRLDGQPGLSELCWPEVKSKYSKRTKHTLIHCKKEWLCKLALNILTANGWILEKT